MLTTRRRTKTWEEMLLISVFALLSYLLYAPFFLLVRAVFNTGGSLRFFEALFDEGKALSASEVGWASLAAVVVGMLAAWVDNHKCVNKLARRLGVTKKYGDDDLWLFLHNMPRNTQWVFVRDHKVKLTYYGWVKVFSDSEMDRELILDDVDVFDESSNLLHSTPTLYMCRDKHDLSIELPAEDIPSKPAGTQPKEPENE
jgi:hypothetical protein